MFVLSDSLRFLTFYVHAEEITDVFPYSCYAIKVSFVTFYVYHMAERLRNSGNCEYHLHEARLQGDMDENVV